MSLSMIFGKLDDLERKINTAVIQPTQQASANSDDLNNKLQAVEAIQTNVQQLLESMNNVNNKLAVLEANAVMPADLPEKVDKCEAVSTQTVADLQVLAQRLDHLETVTLPHVVSRMENIEHKLNDFLER